LDREPLAYSFLKIDQLLRDRHALRGRIVGISLEPASEAMVRVVL
jgi:hypothetical protein